MAGEANIVSGCVQFWATTGAVITWAAQTLATIGAVWIAYRGLETWRKQLHGSDEYTVTTETLSACWALKGAMHAVHHKQIGSHEINRYTSDLDDLHPRLGFLHRSAQVLEVRIRPVTEAQKQLNEIAPRLAAVIDPKLLDHTSEMISLSNHLVVSLDQAFLSLKLAKNVNREDRLHAIADATTKHIEQLIGAEAEATTRKASVALASIEEALKPYTPNLRAKRLFRRVSKKAR